MLLRTRRAVRIVKRSNCKYINSYYYVCSLGAKQNNDKKTKQFISMVRMVVSSDNIKRALVATKGKMRDF